MVSNGEKSRNICQIGSPRPFVGMRITTRRAVPVDPKLKSCGWRSTVSVEKLTAEELMAQTLKGRALINDATEIAT